MIFLLASIRRRVEHRPNLLRVLANISWLTVDKVLRMGVGLVIGIWVARHLGPEMFGALSFALAFVGLFGPIAAFGLKQIVVRDLVKEHEETPGILGTAVAIRMISGLVAYGLMVAAIMLLRPDDGLAQTMVMIVGLMVVVQASEIAAFWFEAQVRSKYTVLATGAAFAVFTLVRIALLVTEAPVMAFAIAASAEAALATCLLVIMFLRKGEVPKGASVHADRARQLLRDSWPLFLSGIAITVYMRIDQVMLGQLLDDSAVGLYSVAVRISEVWYFLPTIITASVFPALVATRQWSEPEYYARLQRLFDLLAWLAIGIAVPMTFLATPLVTLLFGEAYRDAGAVLAIHIWAGVFVALGVASGKWYVLENRQLLSLQRTVLGAVANASLNLVLIPRLGVVGAAWATLFSQALAAVGYDAVQGLTRRLFIMKLRSFFPIHLLR